MSEPDLDFDIKLMQKIRGLFRKGRIITSNILYAFHDYDVNILGEQDIQHVKAEINNHGETEGSFLLLHRLISYKNWFSCLLKVLRDSQVKQGHVADEIEMIYKDLKGHKFDEQGMMTTSYRDQYVRQKSTGDLDMMNYEKEIQQDLNLDTTDFDRVKHGANHSVGDLQLIDNTWEIVGAPMNAGDTAVGLEDEESDDCESFVVLGKGTIPEDFQPPLVQEENGRYVVQSKLQRSITSDYISATESVEDETLVNEIYNSFCKLDEDVEATQVQEVPEMSQQETLVKEPAHHGPEYDFDPETVEKELGDLEGWHPNISEREIYEKLNPLLSEDGHYLLFYWPKRKRPAMSVTFNKSFITFTVHKRPRKENKSNAEFFYIYKSEKKASSLATIVKYHLEHGLCYTTAGGEKKKVSFDHPVALQ